MRTRRRAHRCPVRDHADGLRRRSSRRCSRSASSDPPRRSSSRPSPTSPCWVVDRYRWRALADQPRRLGDADVLAAVALRRRSTRRDAQRRVHRSLLAAGRGRRPWPSNFALRVLAARRCSTAQSLRRDLRATLALAPAPSRLNVALVAVIAEVYDAARARRARLRAAQRRRVHVHDAPGRRRARAHAPVRDPLVGRALRARSARSTSATRAPRATAPPSAAFSRDIARAGRHVRARPGARAHRRAAARHRASSRCPTA